MPTEHERETAFLKECVQFEGSPEGSQLCGQLAQLQRDERSVRRAWWMLAFVAALAASGIVYGAVFLEDFPARMNMFGTQFVIRASCGVGMGALICLFVFTFFWLIYRWKLNQRREECRQLVLRLLESRLGRPTKASPQKTSPLSTGESTGGPSQAPA